MDKEINLNELYKLIKKSLVKIVFFTFIVAAIMFSVSNYLIMPQFEASTSMIIIDSEGKKGQDISKEINELKFNKELVNTYSEIIKTRGVANIVISNLDLDISYEEFKARVSVGQKNNTEIFEIKVIDTIPERARDIANETSDVFKEVIIDIMKIDNVQILDKAIVPSRPISPKIERNTLLGAIAGFMISVFMIIIKETFDTRVKSPEDVSENFDIPVLGVIPEYKKRPGRR